MNTKPGIWSLLREHIELAKSLRKLEIHFDVNKCEGVWQCYEVCPIGCWTPDLEDRKVIFHNPELCIACGACVLQCPEDAILLKVPDA